MWEKIKKILDKEGGKCFILENGQAYVVSRYDEGGAPAVVIPDEIEKANKDLEVLKSQEDAQQQAAEAIQAQAQETNNDIKIENLPF